MRYDTDEAIRTPQRVPFESLHQERFLKGPEIYRFGDESYERWFTQALGMSHSAYFERYHLGAVVTYLTIEVFPVRFMPRDAVTVVAEGILGRHPHPRGEPRYGAVDRLSIENEAGETAARLESNWLWFNMAPGKKPATITTPPPEAAPVDRVFPAIPAVPAGAGERINGFRWAPRETDLNQHVNSMAWVARAENALADAGVVFGPLGKIEIWYQRPGFQGEAMESYVDSLDGAHTVRLVKQDGEITCAVARFTPPSHTE